MKNDPTVAPASLIINGQSIKSDKRRCGRVRRLCVLRSWEKRVSPRERYQLQKKCIHFVKKCQIEDMIAAFIQWPELFQNGDFITKDLLLLARKNALPMAGVLKFLESIRKEKKSSKSGSGSGGTEWVTSEDIFSEVPPSIDWQSQLSNAYRTQNNEYTKFTSGHRKREKSCILM